MRIGPSEVSVTDLQTARQIHRVQSKFLKTDFYPRLTNGFVNVFSILSPKAHAERRRLLAMPLSEKGLRKFEDVIMKTVIAAVEGIEQDMKSHSESNVAKWFLFMATDVIGQLTFGESFKVLDKGEETQYIKDLQRVINAGTYLLDYPRLLVLPLLFLTKKGREFVAWNKRLSGYGDTLLSQYRALVERDGDDVVPTLFTDLYRGEEAGKLTHRDISTESRGYIVAGTDTTANTMTYLSLLLARHPDLHAQLRKAYSEIPENPTFDDLKRVTYAENLFKEVLRLYGPVNSILPRSVPPEGHNIGSYHIPGGTTISCSAALMHRLPDIYEEPDK